MTEEDKMCIRDRYIGDDGNVNIYPNYPYNDLSKDGELEMAIEKVAVTVVAVVVLTVCLLYTS